MGDTMFTQRVAGRVFDFNREVRMTPAWRSRTMVSVAVGEGDAVYVINRGTDYYPNLPWNQGMRGNRLSKIMVGNVPDDEEFVAQFGKDGDSPGEFTWPVAVALDSQENAYVTDEWLNRVSIFDKEGNFLRLWGKEGDGEGEFESPWGITIDQHGDVYVADHNNHRVQKLSPDGQLMATFGSYGDGEGQLNRPTDVAVDPDGDVYICDWANDRVQVFGPDGEFLTSLLGDAQEMSEAARATSETNPEAIKLLREARRPELIGRFSFPTGITFDPEKHRIIVTDSQRGRLQIYDKSKN